MEVSVIEKIGGCKRIGTILITATVCGLIVMGKPVPELISNAFLLVIGTYFGQSIANGKK